MTSSAHANTTNMVQYHAFWRHIHHQTVDGQTCSGEAAKFVPSGVIANYWNQSRVREILRGLSFPYPTQTVLSSYRLLLSILVDISQEGEAIRFLEDFALSNVTDASLPVISRPDFLPDSDHYNAFWERFSRTQWKYCPVQLGFHNFWGRRIFPESILPFTLVTNGTQIGNTKPRRCSLSLIAIMDECEVDQLQGVRYAVLKTFSRQARVFYDAERRAYLHMGDSQRKSQHVLDCYGSFEIIDPANPDLDRFCIIIEHADQGSLLDVFTRGVPPRTPAELRAFWSSITQFLIGVEKLHAEESIHQDLKPANVFIHTTRPAYGTLDPFTFTAKVGDFDMSSVRPNGQQSSWSSKATFSGASMTYSAPEVHFLQQVVYQIDCHFDLWACAAIILETAVWVTRGHAGRLQFARQRLDENSTNNDLINAGLGDCFHDGSKPLASVRNAATSMSQYCQPWDNITSRIAEEVLTCVLEVQSKDRPPAGRLHAHLRSIITGRHDDASPHPHRSVSVGPFGEFIGTSVAEPISLEPEDGSETHQSSPSQPSSFAVGRTLSSNKRSHRRTSPYPMGSESIVEEHEIRRPQSEQPAFGAAPVVPYGMNPHAPQFITPVHSRSSIAISIPRSPAEAPLLSHSPDSIEQASPPRPHEGARSETQAPAPANNPDDRSKDPYPRVTFEHAAHCIRHRKAWNRRVELPSDLPGWVPCRNNLKSRDHIILIDNSRHMQDRRAYIIECLSVMAYILKTADIDGSIQWMLTSDNKLSEHKKSSLLVMDANQRFAEGKSADCAMERCLGTVFNTIRQGITASEQRAGGVFRHFTNRSKSESGPTPVSVHIITNGVWSLIGGNQATGVQDTIRRLAEFLRGRNSDRTQVTLQFASFGDSAEGERRLDELDQLFKKDGDFIDHKRFADGVWPVLIGSIDESNDLNGDSTEDPVTAGPGFSQT